LVDFQKYSYTEYADVLDKKSKDEVDKIQSGILKIGFSKAIILLQKFILRLQLTEIIVMIITINFLELWKTNS
jgi:hypothetical protein